MTTAEILFVADCAILVVAVVSLYVVMRGARRLRDQRRELRAGLFDVGFAADGNAGLCDCCDAIGGMVDRALDADERAGRGK